MITTLYYYPFILTLVSCMMIGILAGALGTFTFLNKQSLLGDTISHASLPGFVLGLYLTGSKEPWILMLCGASSSCLGTILMVIFEKTTTLKKETILGIILSVFFGIGLLCSSYIQSYQLADQALVHKLLFGNASIILLSDVYTIGIATFAILGLLWIFRKELVMASFDPLFAQSIGYNTQLIQWFLLIMCIISIVIGLQIMGVILMSSLLIAPSAAARQWTTQLHVMIRLSSIIATTSCMVGAYLSMVLIAPTGPIIIILLSMIVALSLFIPSKMRAFNRKSAEQ